MKINLEIEFWSQQGQWAENWEGVGQRTGIGQYW